MKKSDTALNLFARQAQKEEHYYLSFQIRIKDSGEGISKED
jgi:hypothetical protein